MKNKRLIIFFSFIFLKAALCAQQPSTLTLTDLLNIVRKFNPIALQANISVDSARANLLSVRGAFDPALAVYNEQKTFDGKNYFFYTNPELKIPTWYGIEFKTGLENNGGSRLDEEATAGRSSYAGISVPLLNNLVLDRRRASLHQAKILIKQSEAERLNAYNDLLLEATKSYWDWVREYQVYNIIKNTIEVNKQRYQLVKRSFAGGDRAAIDTVEALTQLQTFLFLENEAYMRWMDAGYELSTFMWLDKQEPYRLPVNVIPDSSWNITRLAGYPIPSIDEAIQTTLTTHPKLQSIGFKLNILEVERKLKFQSLLPKLNVNYNFLSKGYEPWKNVGSTLFQNNYKFGIDFGVPLFQRQARGDLKLARLKIDQTELQRKLTSFELENKLRTYHNQASSLKTQIGIYEEVYRNYQKLLSVEELKFSIGESSLFLVNSRELKAIEAQQKLMELKTKFFKSLASFQWATGQF